MFFFIRYYTILLLAFDVAQIHIFAIKGVPNKSLCIAFDPITRVLGAISLWAVEIIMQIRIFALYERSKKVAVYNACFFVLTIVAFAWLTVLNTRRRPGMIAHAMVFPLPGCPTINGGLQWTLWIPATIFELNLLGFALWRSFSSPSFRKINKRVSLVQLLLQENILYFFGITCVLLLNNLMTIPSSGIPWFSFGPFHACLGIMTARMHIHLRKFSVKMAQAELSTIKTGHPVVFLDLSSFHDDDEDSLFSGESDPESVCAPSIPTRKRPGDVENQTSSGSTSTPHG